MGISAKDPFLDLQYLFAEQFQELAQDLILVKSLPFHTTA
jgi:hypothetical protein